MASGGRLRDLARPLGEREFRLLWAGTLVSNTGDWMDQVALNWLVLQRGGSAIDLGLVNLCRGLPILALTLFGGVAADRVERRTILLAAQGAALLLAGLLAVMAGIGADRPGLILAIAAARGSVIAFNQPARQSLVPDLVPRAVLPQALALMAMTLNLTKVLGPLLAGLVIALWGSAACFAANAAGIACVLALVALMRPGPHVAATAPPVLRALAQGISFALRDRSIRALVSVALITVFLGQPFVYLLALMATEVFGTDAMGLGLMTACAAGGSIGGALLVGTVTGLARSGRAVIGLMLALGLSLVALSLAPTLWVACAVLLACGLCQTAFNAANQILLQTIVPAAMRGRVLGLLFLNKGVVQLGTAALAALAWRIGVAGALMAAGLMVAALALAVLSRGGTLPRLRTE